MPPIRRRLPSALAILVLVGYWVVPGPASAASASDVYERDTQRHTNAERTKRGLPALSGATCVDRYAERLAAALVKEQRLRHSDLGTIVRACRLRTAGENVAVGYRDGRSVTAAWMASPGHRANILHRDFRVIGIGAARDQRGRWWVAQVFGR